MMRGVQYVGNIQMVTEVCCNCSMLFAVPKDFQDRRVKDRLNFYCPSGHPQSYRGPSEESRLKQELERKQQMLDAERARAATLTNERDATAKAHKRMRTRIQNGVCPCCNRTFQNLLMHMRTEHADQPTVKSLREAYGLTQAALAKEIGVLGMHISLAERGKPTATYAQRAINSWVEAQAPKTAKLKETQP